VLIYVFVCWGLGGVGEGSNWSRIARMLTDGEGIGIGDLI